MASIVISVENESGVSILEEQKVPLLSIGDSYVAEPFDMESGNYFLTKFFILDAKNQIIYAAVLQDSQLEKIITNPLPMEFVVLPDQISDVVVEVVNAASYDLEDLGYPIVVDHGLIAFYPFNGNTKDYGANQLDGILGDGISQEHAPVLITDRHGNANSAYSFDGNDYIDLSEHPLFDLGDYEEFSISCWIKPVSHQGAIVSKYIAASDNRVWIMAHNKYDSKTRFAVHHNGIRELRDVVEMGETEGWHNITVVLKDAVYTLYKNGVIQATEPKTGEMKADSPTAKTLIGAVHHSNVIFDAFYTGDIDDVRIYNRALSDEEIALLAHF